jgi:hypothetical protein
MKIAYRGLSGPAEVTVVFDTPEPADACFTKLWRRLGKDFSLLADRRDPWVVAAAPLGLLVAVLVLTTLLAITTSTFDSFAADRPTGVVSIPAAGVLGNPGDGPASPLERWLGWMDWRVVCGLGGAAAAAMQVWLYRLLTAPQVRLDIVRA